MNISTINIQNFGLTVLRALRRHRLACLVAFAALLLYTLLGFWWLPNSARQWAVNYVRTEMHRSLELGSVDFNPFTLTARIRDGLLKEADGSLVFRIDELRANFEVSSLWHRAYTFKQVRLTAPNLQVRIGADGTLNLAKLGPEQSQQTSGQTGLPAVRIGSLELVRGEVHVEDRSRPQPFTAKLVPVEFTLKDFRTQPDYQNAYHFSATSAAGEHLDWSGEFTLQPLGSAGQFRVAKLQATTIADYLQETLPFAWQSGVIDLNGTYQLRLGGAAELSLNLPSTRVADIKIGPRGAQSQTWIAAPQIELRNIEVALAKRGIGIQALHVQGLNADIQRRMDGSINLLELLGPTTPSNNGTNNSNEPWSVHVDAVNIDTASVHVQDLTTTPAASIVFAPVTFKAQDYSTAPDAAVKVQAELAINDRGALKATGTVRPNPLNAQVTVDLADLNLAPFQPYIAQTTDMVLQTGRLSMRGDFSYGNASGTAKPNAMFNGDIDIADLTAQDRVQGQDFLKWQLLRLGKLKYQSMPAQLSIEEVYARRPYSRFIIESDHSTNVQHVLRLQPTAAVAESGKNNAKNASKSQPTESPMRTRVKKVTVDNGSAFFADYSVQPSFSTGLVKLNGNVSGLSSLNDTRAKVKLEGSVDNYAPVSISGEVNFLAAETYSDLAMHFRNMELTTFNPYSGKFAGYSIAKGKLSTELRYRIRDRQLDAQHHIVIDQLEFGPATDSKDAVPLPIKFAVSLLKDRNGVIDLDLPVGGSLDDPTFKIGPIIWKAFVNLLTKVVTAPFSALGALFGGGEELAYVDFAPGSATLAAEQAGKLGKLSAALAQRPQLRVDVPLTAIAQTDVEALNKAAYEQALATVLPKTNPSSAERLATMTTLYQRQKSAKPAFPAETKDAPTQIAWLETQLRSQFVASEEERTSLARRRAEAVQNALLANNELSADRVFLTTETAEVKAPEGVARMELKLDGR